MAEKLQQFVAQVERLCGESSREAALLDGARAAMKTLVAVDDWLPEAVARPHPQHYQQYLLHRDPRGRFSVVSFVWGPGQQTPVHDHTVWGIIGLLRGGERATAFALGGGHLVRGAQVQLEPGDVELVSPRLGDIHQVANAFADRVSISIHCYGADIGTVRRHIYDPASGSVKEFVSGYANA